ncbi:MAG: ABC transporter permease [Eubacteriales bacterium]|nr:ABC transporter permease [Eubacteriales bacterium]
MTTDPHKKSRLAGKFLPFAAILLLLLIWQTACSLGWISKYLLPSPIDVCKAFVEDFALLMFHSRVTLMEAFLGLFCGIVVGFLAAVLMDHFEPVYQAFYPLIVLTQTVPTVAIAPLLVLWFGYEMTPKVLLIVLATFFPIAVSMLDGFRQADQDTINLLRSMGASRMQIFRYVKFPGALPQFFASLRISVSYAMVTAVVAEWLGGFNGLGVYMTRVKKSFSFDKMFAVIFLISALSLLLMKLVNVIQKKCMPWEQVKQK